MACLADATYDMHKKLGLRTTGDLSLAEEAPAVAPPETVEATLPPYVAAHFDVFGCEIRL